MYQFGNYAYTQMEKAPGLPRRVKSSRACGYSSPFQRPFQILVIAECPHMCPDLTELFLMLLFSIFESTALKLLQEPCTRTSRPEKNYIKTEGFHLYEEKACRIQGGISELTKSVWVFINNPWSHRHE